MKLKLKVHLKTKQVLYDGHHQNGTIFSCKSAKWSNETV